MPIAFLEWRLQRLELLRDHAGFLRVVRSDFLTPAAVYTIVGMRLRAPLFLLMTLLAAGGCTQMHWVKEGADEGEVRKDVAECGREAWRRAYDRTVYYGAAAPVVLRDSQGRPAILNPYGPFPDPVLLQSQLANFCMRERGYSLVPVKPEG